MTRKVGFINSLGWIEKLDNLIHLLAPLISASKNGGMKDKIKKIKKKIKQPKIKFLRDKKEQKIIVSNEKGRNVKCFLIR